MSDHFVTYIADGCLVKMEHVSQALLTTVRPSKIFDGSDKEP